MDRMTNLALMLPRVARVLDRLDAPACLRFDWKNVRATRWPAATGALKPVRRPQRVAWRFTRDGAGQR